MVWILPIMVVIVIGVKFYTATRMRDLERRLNQVKEGLHQRKEEFDAVQTRQAEVQAEEDGHSERIRFMKELIDDIQIRLTTNEEPGSELLIEQSIM